MSDWPNRVAIGTFVADLDDVGDYRLTTKLTGWDDAPMIRADIANKSQQDGGFGSTGHYGPRVITLEGLVDQASHAAAHAVKQQLLALSPHTVHEFLVDNEAIGETSARVQVTQGAVLDWLSEECFTYSITVTAPDPNKYGPPTFSSTTLAASAGGAGLTYPLTYPLDYGVPAGVVPGAVTLPNAGTASYHPRLRIDGGVTNPVLTLAETGDQIALAFTIPEGQWVDINAGKPREVLLNGLVSLRNRATITGNALAVPVGGGSVSWTADAYTPAHSLSVWGYERADQ